jgi:pimeloyl-ACP methyl ester carboxylesterase
MTLSEQWDWRGRRVRWQRSGSGPPVVFCHGTPWSSWLWRPFADALSERYTVHLWDMPGYGLSSKDPEHRVSLDVQGELLAALLDHWQLDRPHVVAHDVGGAVALRAHLIHGKAFSSLALVDVVALAPWGSDFFRLVQQHADVFEQIPPSIHRGMVAAYVQGAAHHRLTVAQQDALVAPWADAEGQAAFYRQISQADQAHTDDIEPLYATIVAPVLVVWGEQDAWIPVERGEQLARLIPGAQLRRVPDAGHLIHLDQPVHLATTLQRWLDRQAG